MEASSSGSPDEKIFKYAVIGGGIAGVTCVEMVSSALDHHHCRMLLIAFNPPLCKSKPE